MKLNYMAFAIPLFLFFMAVEFYLSNKKKKNTHQFNESIANISVGIAERLTDLYTNALFFFIFSWIHTHAALFSISSSILNWVLLFLFTDLVWYWYHRFGHTVNIFWGVHIVHHQSEDFNYTASVRVTFFQAVARGMFWCILPFIGFPAPMVVIVLMIHGTYPFFTHTELIGKLGWLEYIIVTPSHHRVHHSSNPQYLDKNYGDVLIIWDKVFGTFAEEEEHPVYGLTTPLKSNSFLWQHFHFLLEMYVAWKNAAGWKQKLNILFGKPDAIDSRIRPVLEKRYSKKNAQSKITNRLTNFIKLQTGITLIVLFLILLLDAYLTNTQIIIAGLFIMISVINTGAMLEQRTWIFELDFIKLVLISLFIFTIYPLQIVAALIFLILLSVLLFYKTLNIQYYQLLYEYQH